VIRDIDTHDRGALPKFWFRSQLATQRHTVRTKPYSL
jgi:hypothetical protein